ncbi:MAG TPA: hypothetical protein VEH48_00060 [Candidatus Nitrosopolaris sp.]|nr:hypothetical protein [Candidatus Nitrosopolaris sp.]
MDQDFRGGLAAGQPAGAQPYRPPAPVHQPALQQPLTPPQPVVPAAPAAPAVQTQPAAQSQPAAFFPPAAPAAQPTPQQPPQPAQPFAPQPAPAFAQPEETKKSGKFKPAAVSLAVVVLAVGGFTVIDHKINSNSSALSGYFPPSVSQSKLSIPAYYPVNLPAGFSVGGYKVINQKMLNYVVANKDKDQFYVSVQPLPSTAELTAFSKKVSNQTLADTPAGSGLVGTSGDTLVGSVQTTKNVWILISSTAISKAADLETIIHSFEQVNK